MVAMTLVGIWFIGAFFSSCFAIKAGFKGEKGKFKKWGLIAFAIIGGSPFWAMALMWLTMPHYD